MSNVAKNTWCENISYNHKSRCNMAKGKLQKRKLSEVEKDPEPELPPATRSSDEPPPKKIKWINKQRVLVFSSRGINHRDRHLMEDIKKLMPHHRPEPKMERNKNLFVVNEMCEMRNCSKAIMFEGRKKQDLYMWISNIPQGPSAKFLVENIYTMAELKLTGNCLRGSRPLLSFDTNFSEKPEYMLLKELFTQIFGVPNHHPKSQPFFDHVYTFSVLDNRIWFRNFQILSEDGALAEIGPRFVLNPVKIFNGSFGGQTLWENSHYVTPAKYRQMISKKANNKYMNRITQKVQAEATKPKVSYNLTPLNDIFVGDTLKTAKKLKTQEKSEEKQKDAMTNTVVPTKKPVFKIKKKPVEKQTFKKKLNKNKKFNKKIKVKKNKKMTT